MITTNNVQIQEKPISITILYLVILIVDFSLKNILPFEYRFIVGIYNWLIFLPVFIFILYQSIVLLSEVLKGNISYWKSIFVILPITHLAYFLLRIVS